MISAETVSAGNATLQAAHDDRMLASFASLFDSVRADPSRDG